MKASTLGSLVVALMIAVPGLAVAGPLSVASMGTDASCGDTVADAICTASDLLFGPAGIVPFGTQAIDWAQRVLVDVIFVIAPWGGFL
ncbi:MAG: hypothetical protein ACRDH5_13260 [bacterium]